MRLTTREAALLLIVTPKTVRRWIASGRINAEHPETSSYYWVISEGEIERVLRAKRDPRCGTKRRRRAPG